MQAKWWQISNEEVNIMEFAQWSVSMKLRFLHGAAVNYVLMMMMMMIYTPRRPPQVVGTRSAILL